MGRGKKYQTPEEAHEAKLQQMRDYYQRRKAEKLKEDEPKEETPKVTLPRTNSIKAIKWNELDQLAKALRVRLLEEPKPVETKEDSQ